MYTKGPLETRRVDGAGSVYACGADGQPVNETVEADARLYVTSTKLLEAAEYLIAI
jgi:hypothetical protein